MPRPPIPPGQAKQRLEERLEKLLAVRWDADPDHHVTVLAVIHSLADQIEKLEARVERLERPTPPFGPGGRE